MIQIDHQRFTILLKEKFPELTLEIDDWEGLLHLEMATFCRATQSAIDNQDRATVEVHFKFIDEVFRDAAPDVKNAVYVSYLEHLRFDGRKAGPTKAQELLSPRLRQALADITAHNEQFRRKR